MYGGHITDDWDRRLCKTYLVEYIRAEMLEGEIQLAPGFHIPPNLDYKVRGFPGGRGDGPVHPGCLPGEPRVTGECQELSQKQEPGGGPGGAPGRGLG